MKTLILIGFTLLTASCIEKQSPPARQADTLQAKPHTTDKIGNTAAGNNCNPWLDEVDSTLSSGDYVKYVRTHGRIRIVWANKDFERTLKREFDCDTAPSWIPTIRWTTPGYIGLHYGCGSPCWGTIILPMNAKDSVVERMYEFDVELSRKLIVYLGGAAYDRLTIENWVTRERQELDPEVTCESAFPGYCIDSLTFSNDNLFIRWDKSAGRQNTKKENGRLIKLEI